MNLDAAQAGDIAQVGGWVLMVIFGLWIIIGLIAFWAVRSGLTSFGEKGKYSVVEDDPPIGATGR